VAIDLKKKLGPLPVWAWAGLGAGTIGVIYYIRSKSTSSSTTSATDQQLAAEQAALANQAGYPPTVDTTGPSGGGGPATPVDTTGLATGYTSTDQLAQGLAAISDQLNTLSLAGPVDTGIASPAQTLVGEATDLINAQAALKKLGLGGTATPRTGGTPTAKGKATGLPILAQLQDLQKHIITKNQLGTNAAKQLAATHGNVSAAIARRENKVTQHAKKPTRHTTPSAGAPFGGR